MAKYQNFYNNLYTTVEGLNPNAVKASIGDSINNNRVLTVGQVVRFLSSTRGTKTLGTNLSNIFNLLRKDIISSRPNNRTDAVDINEFINFYENVVIGAREYTSEVGRLVA